MHSEREKIDQPAAFSVLQGDAKFLNKILSRNSSVGRVSQHYRSIGKVPFQWETIPGMPRTNPSRKVKIPTKEFYADEEEEEEEEEISVIRVRPPPVVEGSSMPKKGNSNLRNSSFWRKNIWKRSKKIHQQTKDHHVQADRNRQLLFDNFESFKFSNSEDADFIRTSTSNSISSSSSLPNSADDHDRVPVQSSKLKCLARKIVNWTF